MRIKNAYLLGFVGALLVLAIVMPAIPQPVGPRGNELCGDVAQPRAASFLNYLYTIGAGTQGSDDAHFDQNQGVAVNATGHLYVADTYNHRVQVFDNAGIYQYTICGNGAGSGNDQFYMPFGVAVNATGHLYVVDAYNYRVQVFDNAGVYQYTIGTTGVWGSGNDQFQNPFGAAVNATGHLYVADTDNHRVQVFDNAGIYQYTICGNGAGSSNDQFNEPRGVAVNATGHLYVVDTVPHRVQVFDNAGIYQYTIGTTGVWGDGNGQFQNPFGVAVNATGHVYVADTWNNRVEVFDNAGTYQYTICGNGGGSGNDQFNWPRGAAVNSTGHLYVADTYNYRVQVFDNGTLPPNPPTSLSISINSGAADTSSTSVTLTLSATGATEMCFSNNGTTYTDWETYGTSKTWTLDGGPGPKTVYFNARNGTTEAAAPTTDTITYTLPPTSLSISINSGAAETATTSVTLTLSATGATEMCFSNNGTTYTGWETYGTSKAWTLNGGPGPRTVYFNARNGTIEAAAPVTDDILYVAPPSGLSITINDGAAETATTSVTLTLSATGATEMCFSNDGVSWSNWEPFATTKTWTLAGDAGVKTVYFKARNGTIEAAASTTDTITYAPSSDGEGILGFPVAVLIAVTGLSIVSLRRKAKRALRV